MSADLAIRDEQHYLATVAETRQLAERCETIGDAKALADQARALQVYAERAKLDRRHVDLASAARLWSERRAGELLIDSRENGQRASGHGDQKSESRAATPILTLDDLGVSKHESSRWQQLAEIPAPVFEQAIEEAAENGKVTATAVKRLAVPLSDELVEEQQRQANVRHLSGCLRGLEVSPEHARAEIRRLTKGDHPFTPERFERAATAAQAYAAALREETNGQA